MAYKEIVIAFYLYLFCIVVWNDVKLRDPSFSFWIISFHIPGSKENELKESPPKLNNRTAMTISFNINSNKSPPGSSPATPACSPVSSPVTTSQLNLGGGTPSPSPKSLCSSPALTPTAAATAAVVENSTETNLPPIKRVSVHSFLHRIDWFTYWMLIDWWMEGWIVRYATIWILGFIHARLHRFKN